MVKRVKKTKKTKKLGHRTFGRGNVKNRRGSGNRGGFGKAGFWKHEKTAWLKDKEKFLKQRKGFVSKREKLPSINLYHIQRMIEKGEIEREGDVYKYRFEGKLLGTGELDYPVVIEVISASNRAREKVQKAGGKVVEIGK